MRKFLIVTNIIKDKYNSLTRVVAQKIEENGGLVYTTHFDENWNLLDDHEDLAIIDPNIECALVIGGDGTMLHAEHELLEFGIPMVGLNKGTVGYLADIEVTEWESAVEELLHSVPRMEERLMLVGKLYHNNEVKYEDVVLNDIVVGRKGSLHAVNITVEIDGKLLKTYYADGMIVSTPTGSTAYNLSAGGPIGMPSASLMIITPISPHSLINRSLILPDDVTVRLTLEDRRPTDDLEFAVVSFDGQQFNMDAGDYVEITKAPMKAKLFRMKNVSFMETLRLKMTEGI